MHEALAIDIGGTKVEAAVVDTDGRIVSGTRFRGATGPLASRAELEATIIATAERSVTAHEGSVVGVGIGSAGPIGTTDGTISPINLPRLAAFRVAEAVRRFTTGPVELRLDGTCIALAEHWQGALRGTENGMGIVVSTGIGGGIILGSRLIAGASGNAGHLGQMQLRRREPDAAGAPWTLEGIASGTATVAWARAQGWSGSTGEELGADAAAGTDVAVRAIRRSAEAVGEALCSITTLLDLERVAVGGGFSRVSPDYLDLVQASATASALHDYARKLRVVRSGLDADGPLIGAAALVLRP
ncbi:ROK family protein [Plantibacter sp. ME-Dv--P-095]|uniref:ROK family protein n=1 Tax=Plantibacter sp. ME-Dv--P-095 TaxID=3040299 RepID=UPI00254C1321|nr:ROK family protein [Plantibacter sp. ME-Dv--P-095]